MPSSWPARGKEFAVYLGQAETHQSLRPSNVILRTCLAEETSSSYEQHRELNQTGAVGCSPPSFSSSSSSPSPSLREGGCDGSMFGFGG